jgi:hypothetical protein
MRPCFPRSSFALLSLLIAAPLVVPTFARAQQTATPAPVAAAPTATDPADAPPPPNTNINTMTPAQIADVAARDITASGMVVEKYTYVETEHIQNFIDGQKVVDHTIVTENIFIHNLPYMRKTAEDGQPLTGKELKHETAMYEQAVKQRTALDEAARANLMRHAIRTTSRTDLDKLATNFNLAILGHETIDGHDCVILDATPKPENTATDLARHVTMDVEVTSLVVLNIRIEFLADDNGFSKGSVLDTRYTLINGVPLPTHQTWDTTVTFKELLNKAIRIHRDITYSNYRRFHATATIHLVGEVPAGTPTTPDSAPASPSEPASTDAPKTKAELKAEKKARQEAEKKAAAEFKAQEKEKAAEAAKSGPAGTGR